MWRRMPALSVACWRRMPALSRVLWGRMPAPVSCFSFLEGVSMSCRRVEVLVRAGEVVVVLDSAEELRAWVDRMPGEAVEVDRQPPKAASGSRVEAAGAQVHVPWQLWVRMRLVVSVSSQAAEA